MLEETRLYAIRLVHGQRRHDIGTLDLDALGVDDLTGRHHVCKQQPCPFALVQRDGIHLPLYLHTQPMSVKCCALGADSMHLHNGCRSWDGI